MDRFFQYKQYYQENSNLIVIGYFLDFSYEVFHDHISNQVSAYAYKPTPSGGELHRIFNQFAKSDQEADELIDEACRVTEIKLIDDFRFRLMFSRKKR